MWALFACRLTGINLTRKDATPAAGERMQQVRTVKYIEHMRSTLKMFVFGKVLRVFDAYITVCIIVIYDLKSMSLVNYRV